MQTTGPIPPEEIRQRRDFPPLHPGEVLLAEFIIPLDLCQRELALALDVSPQELDRLVSGASDLTPELARQLAIQLGTTPDFWLILQRVYESGRSSAGLFA